MESVHFTTREEWRGWLKWNHGRVKEIWLVFYKKHTGKPRIAYDDAVEEALCYGWIDSIVKKIDEERYAQKFTPRTNRLQWSDSNVARLKKLVAADRMTEAGLAVVNPALLKEAPPAKPRPRRCTDQPPPWLKKALQRNRVAYRNFVALAPSYRRLYIAWISAAKREETRARRIEEAISLLEKNQKLGLK